MGQVLSVMKKPHLLIPRLFTLLHPQWLPAVPQTQGPIPALGTLNLLYSRPVMLSSDMPKACYSLPFFRSLFKLVFLPQTNTSNPPPNTHTHIHTHTPPPPLVYTARFTLPSPCKSQQIQHTQEAGTKQDVKAVVFFHEMEIAYHYLF